MGRAPARNDRAASDGNGVQNQEREQPERDRGAGEKVENERERERERDHLIKVSTLSVDGMTMSPL